MKIVRYLLTVVACIVLCVLGGIAATQNDSWLPLLGGMMIGAALMIMEELGRSQEKAEMSERLLNVFLAGQDATIDVRVNVKDERT